MTIHLTPRQREIMQHLGDGVGIPEIALKMCISPHTVRFQLRLIADKVPGESKPRHRILRWWFERVSSAEASMKESAMK